MLKESDELEDIILQLFTLEDRSIFHNNRILSINTEIYNNAVDTSNETL